jgi:hypothetical protein
VKRRCVKSGIEDPTTVGRVPLKENILQLIVEGGKTIRKHAKGHVPSKVIAQVDPDRVPEIAKREEDQKVDLIVQGRKMLLLVKRGSVFFCLNLHFHKIFMLPNIHFNEN